jgi:hypothetical protein
MRLSLYVEALAGLYIYCVRTIYSFRTIYGLRLRSTHNDLLQELLTGEKAM